MTQKRNAPATGAKLLRQGLDISTAEHSRIGASSMERWANCPGSVALIQKAPEQEESIYATEGTIAHDLASYWLTRKLRPTFAVGCARATALGYDGFFRTEQAFDKLMESVQIYVVYVAQELRAAKYAAFEQRFDLTHLHEGLFGTGDAVTLYESGGVTVLHVIDFKHGSGIFVPVQKNEQLLYYALGAYYKLLPLFRDGSLPKPEHIKITIVQPRFPCPETKRTVRHDFASLMELQAFQTHLVEAAKRTREPNAPLVVGDYCRFCAAKSICPAFKDRAFAEAKKAFSPVTVEDMQEIGNKSAIEALF